MPYFAAFLTLPGVAFSNSSMASFSFNSGSYTRMAKPIKSLKLHYPMIQFLIIIIPHKRLGWLTLIFSPSNFELRHLLKCCNFVRLYL